MAPKSNDRKADGPSKPELTAKEAAAAPRSSKRAAFRRIVFYSWLVTSPLWLAPFLCGIIGGVLVTQYANKQVSDGVAEYLYEVESDAGMEYFNVPGAPSIFDVNTGPFHNSTKLRTLDWVEKLGLKRGADYDEINAPIDQAASLEGLRWREPVRFGLRRTGGQGDTSASFFMSKWIYVTGMPMPDYNGWDGAFNDLLMYHAAHPPANDAELFYVDSWHSAFLCRAWAVKTPTMVHLSVDWNAPVLEDGTRPVDARVIDFPLDDWVPLPGKFPTEFEQLRVLTTGKYTVEDIDTYVSFVQFMERFYDHLEEICKRYTILEKLFNFSSWLGGKLPQVEWFLQFVSQSTFLVTGLLGKLVSMIYYGIMNLWSWFMGQPGADGTPLPDSVTEAATLGALREQGGGLGAGWQPGENFMGDMLLGFMDSQADQIGQVLKDIPAEEMEELYGLMEDPLIRDTLRDSMERARLAAMLGRPAGAGPTGSAEE